METNIKSNENNTKTSEIKLYLSKELRKKVDFIAKERSIKTTTMLINWTSERADIELVKIISNDVSKKLNDKDWIDKK